MIDLISKNEDLVKKVDGKLKFEMDLKRLERLKGLLLTDISVSSDEEYSLSHIYRSAESYSTSLTNWAEFSELEIYLALSELVEEGKVSNPVSLLMKV